MDVNGTAYDLTGPEDAPAIVLIHGLGLNRQITWDGLMPELAARYRVLRYDLLGHGQSAIPDGEVTLTALSKQLVKLMDHVQIDRAALVGFSLGGMINRRTALDHPGRVSALAILNSPHERAPEAQKLYEDAARESASGGPEVTVDAALLRWFTDAFRVSHPEVVDQTRQIVVANDSGNYAAHRYVLAAGVTELIRPSLPIKAPTLVLTCEHDSGSTPAMSWAIAHEMQDARVEIIPDLRHLGLLEHPQACGAPLMRFLNAVLTG